MPRVLISAGHTVMDPGAIYGDLREADLTRKIAPMVLNALAGAGLEMQAVPLDLALPDRIQWINGTGYSAELGDILVEIHVNDADGTKRGLEIWYEGGGNNESEKIGAVIADSVISEHGLASQGVRSEQDHDLGSLRFLNATLPHASIVEVLFIDNQEDVLILRDDNRLQAIAQSIAKGIARYCGKNLDGSNLAPDQAPNFNDLIAKYSIKPSGKPKSPFGGFGFGPFDDDLDSLLGDDLLLPNATQDANAAASNLQPNQAAAQSFGAQAAPQATQNAAFPSNSAPTPIPTFGSSSTPNPANSFGNSGATNQTSNTTSLTTNNNSPISSNPAPAASAPFGSNQPTNPSANPVPTFGGAATNNFGGSNASAFGSPTPAPAFGGGASNAFGAAGATGLGASTFMDREKRKEMIENTYLKVLGIKPEDKDLNLHLNKGISEAELTQKLIDSEQHTTIVKSKEELDKIKKDHEAMSGKMVKLQTTVRDMQEMIAQLNRLLIHKNQAIQNMEKTFSEAKGLPSSVYQKMEDDKKASLPANQNKLNGVKLNPSVSDGVKRRFAKRFS